MERLVRQTRVRVVRGSLLDQKVEVIVNAANTAMRGGGGIDGAVHASAGPGLLEELRRVAPEGCRAGEVVVTSAHRLPFKAIIHTPGPVWRGGASGEAEVLASCYRSALDAAAQGSHASIGFCSISTGIYGYPVQQAAQIAVETVAGYVSQTESAAFKEIVFAMYGAQEHEAFLEALAASKAIS